MNIKKEIPDRLDITLIHSVSTLISEFDTFMNEVHKQRLGDMSKEEVARMKGAFIAGATIMNKRMDDIDIIRNKLIDVSILNELSEVIQIEIEKEQKEKEGQ